VAATQCNARRIWNSIRRNSLLMSGGAIILLFLLVGLFAPVIAPHDPLEQNLRQRMAPGFWAGNYEYLLGTDELGRDILSRIIYGTRTSLLMGFACVLIVLVIGGGVGMICGYYGGSLDAIVMRLVDILLSFPYILLAIAIMAVFGQGITNAVIAVAIVFTPSAARITRSVSLSLRTLPFVEAARCYGASTNRIMFKHLVPNLIPHLIVYGALSMGETILSIAALGFLGLGVEPPIPEWGAMISTGKDMLILGKWWLSAFPGLAITLVVTGFALLGDGLRDLLDPRMRS
jgi:peptide/nickel transport system permease protein